MDDKIITVFNYFSVKNSGYLTVDEAQETVEKLELNGSKVAKGYYNFEHILTLS
jgi:hypothetical protein